MMLRPMVFIIVLMFFVTLGFLVIGRLEREAWAAAQGPMVVQVPGPESPTMGRGTCSWYFGSNKALVVDTNGVLTVDMRVLREYVGVGPENKVVFKGE